MGMISKVASNQMLFFASWMALLLLIFVGFGFFSILLYTSLLLVLFSTTVFLYSIVSSKPHKPVQKVDHHYIVEEEEEEGKDISYEEEISSSDQMENIEINHYYESGQSAAKEAQDLLASSSESGECQDQEHHKLWMSSEDYEEVSWSFQQQDVDHSNDDEYSDGTISDEDSLIEIALPSGHYVGGHQHKVLKDNEPTKYYYSNNYYCSLQHKKSRRELSAEALFSQHTLREFLAEFNDNMSEEENLIEIDISMGSIKYSRFEIKA